MPQLGTPSWFVATIWVLVCLFCIGIGARIVWNALFALPLAYDRLEHAGAPATAVIDECRAGLGRGQGVACRLSMDFDGVTRTWVYPENATQFDGLRHGDAVPMLVDPASPDVVYTVTDVNARTNTGWFGALFAELLVLVGLAALALEANLWLHRP